jgi:AcrR family transcriptional regulator
MSNPDDIGSPSSMLCAGVRPALDGMPLPMVAEPHVRADAARNSLLLLKIARLLIGELGADAVTMDAIAATAGVGKGTLFRRFGSRAGLFMTLVDEDEKAAQHAYLFGPPPLGPGAAPVQRLVAYGHARLRFVQSHLPLLLSANRDLRIRDIGSARLQRTHVRVLLENAGASGNLDVQTDALVGLLDASYVADQLHGGQTVETMSDLWSELTCKLCGA